MARADYPPLVKAVREGAHRITGAGRDYNPLMETIGEARYVLLGAATHGTHDFYQERAKITQRLVRDYGFSAVAVEADWPDAYRVNRYVRGMSADAFAVEALGDFKRFPQWMWRNTDVAEFIEWLREHNEKLPPNARKTGFYGLDLFSLHSSMNAVLRFLESVDPEAAKVARERYSCFDHLSEGSEVYGFLAGTGVTPSCEEAAVAQLMELRQKAMDYVGREPHITEDEAFNAEQNARVVKNAEEYYRTMFLRGGSSWNLRERHMFESLESLSAHLERGQRGQPRIVVWAHDEHAGDARATEMSWRRGDLNLGQLVRESHPGKCTLVGFTTCYGSVTAASEWGGAAERRTLRPALEESCEAAFHDANLGRFLLVFPTHEKLRAALAEPRLRREVGVIYRPETERASHYSDVHLSQQFDAVVHVDKSIAVEPLERTAAWEEGELPQTYPSGI